MSHQPSGPKAQIISRIGFVKAKIQIDLCPFVCVSLGIFAKQLRCYKKTSSSKVANSLKRTLGLFFI